jgi:hypothetical protein
MISPIGLSTDSQIFKLARNKLSAAEQGQQPFSVDESAQQKKLTCNAPGKWKLISVHYVWSTDSVEQSVEEAAKYAHVDTSRKSINYSATGSHTLTQQEATSLAGKYDLNKMTAQSNYDLLCDLTNLNALSTKDVASLTAVPCALFKGVDFDDNLDEASSALLKNWLLDFSAGNLFDTDNLQKDQLSVQKQLSQNGSLPVGRALSDRLQTDSKLLNIINAIKNAK